ncbi:MAG: Rieske (2Fe-2S) protein [Alphaproteobacteria bacterium]|nr:Rieske (2Fe-2S) protein [Alphaproteobacteria bacterium]
MSKSRHIAAKVSEIPPGERKLVSAGGRDIALFNINGEFFAIADKCPHESGSLCRGKLTGLPEANEPGKYRLSRPGEFIRCPWHGWEFDLRTGRSLCDPQNIRARQYLTSVESGETLVRDELRAETFEVALESDYVVIHI